jgi:DNA modification methylase
MTVMQGGLKARDDSDYEKIKKSILTYSFSFPFFIWKSGKTNYLIDGTGRFNCLLKMQKEEGYLIPELPVVYIQCKNKTEAKQKLLRLNSQYGKMTKESVLEFAEDIDLNFDEIALPDSVIDFTDAEEPQETEGDDEAPEVDEKSEPVSKRGEMYELGNSILMCGDSTSAEDVARLMGGEKADMVFTDPPYNMQMTGSCIGVYASMRKVEKDIQEISSFDPRAFLEVLPNVFDKNMNAYIFCNKDLVIDYLNWGKENGYSFNILVWKKPNSIPVGDSHRPDLEYLLLFRKNAIWNNGLEDVNYSRCLEFSRVKKSNETGNHPTVKPVELIENEIKISSKVGSIVVDLFGGSGSTLIACEKNKRRARLMEIDPRYVDVIRKRYTLFAKQNGLKITSGCLE